VSFGNYAANERKKMIKEKGKDNEKYKKIKASRSNLEGKRK